MSALKDEMHDVHEVFGGDWVPEVLKEQVEKLCEEDPKSVKFIIDNNSESNAGSEIAAQIL